MQTAMQLAGCGYGDDGPLYPTITRRDRARDIAISAGNAFIWKPIAMSADRKIQFSWGGPVLVTESGCQALFEREHGIVEVI